MAEATGGEVANLGGGTLRNRDGLPGERRQGQAQPFERLAVEEAALVVEALVRPADGDLRAHDAGAGDSEDPLEILLRPERAELAGARADDRDRLVAERVFEARAGSPVDRVLQ